MTTPLSIYNLIHGGWRSILSVIGISIAIVLIFMQLGFLGAVTDTAVVFYNEMDFDLVACSPDYYNFVDSGRFDRVHFQTLESYSEIESVKPLHVSLGKWNYFEAEVQRGMLIIGIDPDNCAIANPTVVSHLHLLKQPGSILVDRTSKPKFLGSENTEALNESNTANLSIELNGVTCRLAGLFEIGTGLAADGATIVSENMFNDIVPGYSQQVLGMALIRLKPGTDVEIAKDQILAMFPKSKIRVAKTGWLSMFAEPEQIELHTVNVLTRKELETSENNYWLFGTPIGFIFMMGTAVAFIVGAIIVYIVLSSDIAKQIGEYATLKAMGYKNEFLSNTVLEQAFVLAVVSYFAALFVSLILYRVVGDLANLPITMNVTRMIIVFVSSLMMSFISAMIAIQKLRQADPADLF